MVPTRMNNTLRPAREIRIDPIVPGESVPVVPARALRPRRQEEEAPRGEACQDTGAGYHGHMETRLRTDIPTGFEPGSGLFVNTVGPEETAARLRASAL
ncbi:hypothetical protein BMS3Bbin12_01312 [bacterium BMS3Bbin12]|nr:hypothetical protein BMS3Bbin12_01312 [bacterium BMS3Bbin12]GBE50028.1 hypothetical protein BMS3Bbin13_00953 [bacterium BMS3Bbin13]HDO34641.1 hypothetical protein [Chromatiales bacterium]